MKVGELVEWILKHRRGRAFKDWTESQVILEVDKAITAGTIAYTAEHGRLTGVAIAEKNETDKTFEVFVILTTHREALSKLAQHFKNNWTGYQLITHKYHQDGQKQLPLTDRFINKLIRKK